MIKHGTRGGYTNGGCRCDLCSTAHSDYMRAYYKSRGRPVVSDEVRRRRAVLSRYRLASETHDELVRNGCGVCRSEVTLFSPVDHDHSCCPGGSSCGACVRGVLCYSCNTGLAKFRDDPDLLEEAARYLS